MGDFQAPTSLPSGALVANALQAVRRVSGDLQRVQKQNQTVQQRTSMTNLQESDRAKNHSPSPINELMVQGGNIVAENLQSSNLSKAQMLDYYNQFGRRGSVASAFHLENQKG